MTDPFVKSILSRTGRGIIFAAHGVAREFKNPFVESVHIGHDDFVAIVEYLKSLDFEFLGISEVVALSKKQFRHSRHWCHFSFDDGYQNNLDTVYPILKDFKIPFSVYVSTYYVESGDYFPTFYMRYAEILGKNFSSLVEDLATSDPDAIRQAAYREVMYASVDRYDEMAERVKSLFSTEELAGAKGFYDDRPLSVDALKELASDPLVHIGSHNHRHVIMHSGQNPEQMRQEIERSMDRLVNRWKVSAAPTFCYPNGDYTTESTKVCEALNIPLALLTESGFVSATTYSRRMPRFWLATARRAKMVSRLALLGNLGIYLCGRRPPAGLGAA